MATMPVLPFDQVSAPATIGERVAVRLAVYTDYAYHRGDGGLYAERAFALFINELSQHVDQLTLMGRVHPGSGGGRYRIDPAVRFVELPFYASLTAPAQSVRQFVASLRHSAPVLDEVDAVWLLGPHPLAMLFALQAARRRRRIVLGVRQNLHAYVRTRHPHRRWIWAAGHLMEGLWRLIGRRTAVVVVGPELEERYGDARRLLGVAISLVRADDLVDGERPLPEGGEIRVLSVGRLETEKNPLLLADVLERLNRGDRPWRLVVCGEGPMEDDLRRRLEALGVADRCDLLGYVPFGDALSSAYHGSDLLLHVSWTEGLPQVLFEAFAAGLPVVATDVGGIRAAVGDATVLVPAGDADAAAAALRALVDDDEKRTTLVERGLTHARAHTIEAETARVARFIGEASEAR
jgi:glycosyltransferase involved in cell wall biosynthesis